MDVDKVLEDLYSDDYEEEDPGEVVKVVKEDEILASDSEVDGNEEEESSQEKGAESGEGNVGDTSKGTNQVGSENEEEEEIEFVDSTSSTIKDDEDGEEEEVGGEEGHGGEEDEEPDVVQEYEFIENMMSDHSSSFSTLDVSHDDGDDSALNTILVTSNHRGKEWIRILGSTSIPESYIYHINLGSSERGSGEISNIQRWNEVMGGKREVDDDGGGEKRKSEPKNLLNTGFKLLPVNPKPQELPSIKLMSFGSSLDGKSNDPSTVLTHEEGNKEEEGREDENQHISSRLTRMKEVGASESSERGMEKMSKMISGTEDDVEEMMKRENAEDEKWMRDEDGYSGRVRREEEGKIKREERSDRSSPEKRKKEKHESTIGIDGVEEGEREPVIERNEVIHERLGTRNEEGDLVGREMMSRVTKRGTKKSEEDAEEEEKDFKSELRGISNERKASFSHLSFRDVNFDLDLFLEPSNGEKEVFAEFADKKDSSLNDNNSSREKDCNFNQKRTLVAQQHEPSRMEDQKTRVESTIEGGNGRNSSTSSSSSPLILDPFRGLSQSKVTLELREQEEEMSSYQERNGRQEYFRNCPNQVGQEENHIMYQSNKKEKEEEGNEKATKLDEPILPTMIQGMGTGSSSLRLISALQKEKGHESNGDRDWKEAEDEAKGKRRQESEQFYDGKNVRGENREMNSGRKLNHSESAAREEEEVGAKVTGKSSRLPPQRGLFHFKMEISGKIVSEAGSLLGMNEQGHHKNENDGKEQDAYTLSQSKQTSGEDDGDGKEVSLYPGEGEKRRREKSSKRRWGEGRVVKESIYDNEDDQVLMESEGCISATFTVHTGNESCASCCAFKEGNKLQSLLERQEKDSNKNKNFLFSFSSSSNERSSKSNNKLTSSSGSSSKFHSSGTIPNETCINKQPLSPFTSDHSVDVGDPLQEGRRATHRFESESEKRETSSAPFSEINTDKSKFQVISTLEVNDQIDGEPGEGANEIRERRRNEEGAEVREIRTTSSAKRITETSSFDGEGRGGVKEKERWSESRLKESQNLTVVQERLKWLQSKLEQLDQRTIQLAFRNKGEPRQETFLAGKNRRMVRKTTKMLDDDEYDVQNADPVRHPLLARGKFRSESSSSASSSISDIYCSRHRYRNHEYQSTPDIRTSSNSLLILIKRTTSMLRDEVRELELLGKY